MPANGELTEAQQIELAEHLTSELDAQAAARVFYAIEHWWFFGPRSATPDALERHDESRARHERIAQAARALLRELEAEAERERIYAHAVNWPTLVASLEKLEEIAERLAATDSPPPTRGAPRLAWRDELIALVRDHYPPGKATATRYGHFETTIELLLGYLREDLEDLHAQIVRTLSRKPRAPFIMQVDDPRSEPRHYLSWSAGRRRAARST